MQTSCDISGGGGQKWAFWGQFSTILGDFPTVLGQFSVNSARFSHDFGAVFGRNVNRPYGMRMLFGGRRRFFGRSEGFFRRQIGLSN